MSKATRCSECILPKNYPGITFNSEGVCNHCLARPKVKKLGQEKLFGAVAPYRNRHPEYDCIISISGGRDSAFAAYYAVRVLNLRGLAYTYDNGFMPHQTQQNVQAIAEILDLDLVVEKHDAVAKNIRPIISSWIKKPSPAMIGFLCTGCRTGYERGLIKTAQNYQIPLVITGSGEPGHAFAKELLIGPVNNRGNLALVLGSIAQMIANPRYLTLRLALAFVREFFHRFVLRTNLKFVPLFRFIAWNEKEILATIKRELRWVSPTHSQSSWRSDCKIHLVRQYLYRETLGFTKNDVLLSGMIRRNMITRHEALERLKVENQISKDFLETFFDEMGLSLADLVAALSKYKERQLMAAVGHSPSF